MSQTASRVTERAAELRADFDRAFAAPLRFDTATTEDLLAIGMGSQMCAIRLREIAGLFAGKKITRIPGSSRTLCGIAGFRGALLPVYDLQLLLGHAASETRRWMVIASGAPVAFAFDAFVGQLRITSNEIAPQAARKREGPELAGQAREFVRTQTFIGPIVHLPSVVGAIQGIENASKAH